MRYRVVILTIIVGAMLSVGARAQSVLLGAHAGVNFSTASADEKLSLSSTRGLILGALLDITVVDPIAFRVGLQYVEEGSEFVVTSSSSTPPGTAPTVYELNYLDLPVNLKMNFGTYSFGVYVFGGTTVGSLLSAHRISSGQSTDISEDINSVNVSLDLGAGLGFEIAPRLSFLADGTFSFGLTDVAKSTGALDDTDSWKARNFKLITGINYRL